MSDPQEKEALGEEVNTSEALVSPPVTSIQPPASAATEDEEESDDESEILEESPCGRWQKRREEVTVHVARLIKLS